MNNRQKIIKEMIDRFGKEHLLDAIEYCLKYPEQFSCVNLRYNYYHGNYISKYIDKYVDSLIDMYYQYAKELGLVKRPNYNRWLMSNLEGFFDINYFEIRRRKKLLNTLKKNIEDYEQILLNKKQKY